jgi:hypothetical protein
VKALEHYVTNGGSSVVDLSVRRGPEGMAA